MIEYLESITPATQVILLFIGLAILFLVVIANNRRNKNKLKNRKGKNFRERYNERKNLEERH